MKSILTFLVCLGCYLIIGSPQNAFAQKSELNKLAQQTKAAVRKSYAASVRIFGFDTVKSVQNSSQFSGVVVDANGTILTVSHAIQPNRIYKVRFPDGQETLAIALGKMGFPDMQTRPDLGMMKIIKKGDWPFVEMGWSYSLKVNQPCISISYPETLNQLLPTVRFGKIKRVVTELGFIESTCKMEPGDSGGPLFDLFGRVVGMHSRCDPSEDQNYEVPIDSYRRYWKALAVAENYKTLPATTDEVKIDPNESIISTGYFLEDLSVAFSFLKSLTASEMSLTSAKGDINQRSSATLVDYKGKTFLIGKSSIVFDHVSAVVNGKEEGIKILARDLQKDLVLLSASPNMGKPIDLKSNQDHNSPAKSDLGMFLASTVGGHLRVSVLSSLLFDLPKKFSAGFIGAAANFKDAKATVIRLAPESPAVKAGIKQGDDIVSINGVTISSADVFNREMQKTAVGDTVSLYILRAEIPQTIKIVASQRPPSGHTSEQFEGGKSIRLDDFHNIFVHDAMIKPSECGSPVFDNEESFTELTLPDLAAQVQL